MTQKLLDLSGKIKSPILEILEAISNIAASLNIPFFVVGAVARDIILHYGYGVEIIRATEDIDLGVMVEDWVKFTQLKEAIIGCGTFDQGREPQRFFYKDNFPVDIVPFGQISKPKDTIEWPEFKGIEMSTLGFKESFDNSILVRLRTDPDFEIRFASLAGLAAMKLISWKDKYPERNKDAKDLKFIMLHYLEAGNFQRIYEGEDSDILEDDAADYELMSARLLGRDVATIITPESKEYILKILNEETGEQVHYKLAADMRQGPSYTSDDFVANLNFLEAFKKGFLDIKLQVI
jgi:predicted nucleotidyltransferase